MKKGALVLKELPAGRGANNRRPLDEPFGKLKAGSGQAQDKLRTSSGQAQDKLRINRSLRSKLAVSPGRKSRGMSIKL
jgi:hypothetical protein